MDSRSASVIWAVAALPSMLMFGYRPVSRGPFAGSVSPVPDAQADNAKARKAAVTGSLKSGTVRKNENFMSFYRRAQQLSVWTLVAVGLYYVKKARAGGTAQDHGDIGLFG